jgi:anthranilate phosphoribosyltransferase
MSEAMRSAIAALSSGSDLAEDALSSAFAAIMAGEATAAQIGGFLVGLNARGFGAREIAAGARALRAAMTPVETNEDVIDVCGTGGDGSHTLNISTAVSFVLAGCGLKVAKHGNRGMSSQTGAADVLEALGVRLDSAPGVIAASIHAAGVGFMFAQAHHPSLRHAAPVRRELGVRTVFNLLGPLSNPAGARRQIVGVYDGAMLEPVAQALSLLGARAAWVLHGDGGVDEAVLSGPTQIAALDGTAVRRFAITPEDAGLARAPLSALRGGDALHNAKALAALLEGAPGPYRDAVLLNAACALVMTGVSPDLKAGVARAAAALDDGGAKRALGALKTASEHE